jgi:hypothetical protein
LTPQRKSPPPTPPDLSPEKAFSALSKQLEALQELKTLSYHEGEPKETQWAQLTQKLIVRSFGSDSLNSQHFLHAQNAGEYYVQPYGYGEDHALNQSNYQARLQAYEGVLNSCLSELKLDMPEPEIQSVFEPGQQYEFYAAVKKILGMAQKEIFVIDPYIDAEMFDVYAGSIPRSVSFRLLSNNANAPSAVMQLAQKYSAGGNFEFRSSTQIHDRVLFADERAWVCGQSLKDAAKKKATYIVEIDAALMRPVYDGVWSVSTKVV